MAPVGCIPHGTSAIIIQTILYFVGSFLGFFVTIPVGITLRNFHGACILFAEVVRWERDIIWPWNEPSCLYVLYMNLAVNIFYATFMGFINLLIYCKKPLESKSSLDVLLDWNISYILRAFNPIFLIVNFCIMFFEIASASILTAGLAEFCNKTVSYINKLPNKMAKGLSKNSSYLGCFELGPEEEFWSQLDVVRGTDDGVRGHSFYGCLVVASIAAWLLFIIWLAQFGLNVLMSCRVCSCDVAEEKKKPDKTAIIAQRRSRLATPIATPGGMLTPSRGLNLPNPMGNQYRGMTPMGAASYEQYPPAPQAEALPGKRPPPSPAESSTPPKQDLSLADSSSPRQLPAPKQKQVYRKNPPSTSPASHLV